MKKAKRPDLILASSSPRRRTILKQLNLEFQAVSVEADETVDRKLKPERLAIEIARKKALSAVTKIKADAVVITSDTIVTLTDGTILGKPSNEGEAKDMLSTLQGNTHIVITAVALLIAKDKRIFTAYDKSAVTFLPMTDEEIDWYISTGEPMDKAGAYGLQGKGMLFVSTIEGSAANVIGLPIHLLYQLAAKAGIDLKDYIKKD